MWVKLSVLSNLTRVTYSSLNESPDMGRKKIEAKWLARTLRQMWELLPSAEVGSKKINLVSYIVVTRWGEAHTKTPGKERRKYLGQVGKGILPSSQTPKIK